MMEEVEVSSSSTMSNDTPCTSNTLTIDHGPSNSAAIVTPSAHTQQFELLYVVYNYLRHTCNMPEAALAIEREIQRLAHTPARLDYNGAIHTRTFLQMDLCLQQFIHPGLLASVFERMNHAQHTPSLMTNAQHYARHTLTDRILQSRELCGPVHGQSDLANFDCRYQFHTRILAHLSPIFCVKFDMTGQYAFTGADDNLVKLWSVHEGRLLFTFRGADKEITDLSVSQENTYLAAGSNDKLVRVWCLRTGALTAVLQGHTSQVNSVDFMPYMVEEQRYLVSTGNDCNVCFWQWNAANAQFNSQPVKFNEKTNNHSQMLCATVSPGGYFVATGATDNCLRVYRIDPDMGPLRAHEQVAHSYNVDSLVWASDGLRFMTGSSKDEVVKLWRYERQSWKVTSLAIEQTDTLLTTDGSQHRGVSMLCWLHGDEHVACAYIGGVIRVWTSHGLLLRLLIGHQDDAFVMERHPLNPNVFMSAAHDGLILVWNIHTGEQLARVSNAIDDTGGSGYFDATFSPAVDQAAHIVAVDAHGQLTIIGLNTNGKLKTVPKEQFFHTDYRPIILDGNYFVADAQSGRAPHMLPPPILVNSNAEPWPAEYQRLVPGNERYDLGVLHTQLGQYTPPTPNHSVQDHIGGDRAQNGARHVGQDAEGTVQVQGVQPVQAAHIEQQQHSVWAQGRALVRPLSPRSGTHYKGQDPAVSNSPLNTHPALECVLSEQRVLAEREYEVMQYEANRSMDELDMQNEPDAFEHSRSHTARRHAHSHTDTTAGAAHSQAHTRRRQRRRGPTHAQDDAAGNDERVASSDEPSLSSLSSDSSDTDYEHTLPSHRHSTVNATGDGDAEDGHGDHEDDPADMPSTSQEQASVPMRRRRRRRRVVVAEQSEEETERDRPQVQIRHRRRAQRTARHSLSHEGSDTSVMPEWATSFPEHMSATHPARSPYHPQTGDIVVYCRQGHQDYLRKVQDLNIYPVTQRMFPRDEFDSEEMAIVLQVRYVMDPYRLVVIRMEQMRRNERTGTKFVVRYHDMDGVPDFIVLKQHYDQSIGRQFAPGDYVKALVDGQWFYGHVDRRTAYDAQRFPRSKWLCVHVRWENGDEEHFSPWELQSTTANRANQRTAPCEQDARAMAQYTSQPGDWPEDEPGDVVCARLSAVCEQLGAQSDYVMFVGAVDISEYSAYPTVVPYPVDLQLISERLTNGFYRRLSAVQFDVEQMLRNAIAFNEMSSAIVRTCKDLVETLITYMHSPVGTELSSILKAVKRLADKDMQYCNEALRSPWSTNLTQNNTTNNERSAVNRMPEWLVDCREVLRFVCDMPEASVLLTRDSMDEASVLYNNDMNLTLIMERLTQRQYATPQAMNNELTLFLDSTRNMCTSRRSRTYLALMEVKTVLTQRMGPVLERFERRERAERQNGSVANGHTHHMRRRLKAQVHEYYTRSSSGAERGGTSSRRARTRRLRADDQPATSGSTQAPSNMAGTAQSTECPLVQRRTSKRAMNTVHSSSSDEPDDQASSHTVPTRKARTSYQPPVKRRSSAHTPESSAIGRNGVTNANGTRTRTRNAGVRVATYREVSDDSEPVSGTEGDQTHLTGVSRSGRHIRPPIRH